jgi:hypothetical protein
MLTMVAEVLVLFSKKNKSKFVRVVEEGLYYML